MSCGVSSSIPEKVMSKSLEAELKSLFEKGIAGDSSAYRAFLVKMSALLRQYVRRQLFRTRRPESACEDIVQETLIAIHQRRHTYDRETPLTVWASAIARYKVVDEFRSNAQHSKQVSLDDIELMVDDSIEHESRISVQKLMRFLPERLRRPIELMKLEGLTSLEAANRLGTSEATVRVNVHRGLDTLARLCGVQRFNPNENR